MPVMRVIYIGLVVATIVVRAVILARNIRTYMQEGEEGLRAEGKRAAIDRMTGRIKGGY